MPKIMINLQITWLDNWNSPIKDHIQTIVETLPDGKRKNTRSVLKLVVARQHHNTSLTCEAQNSAEAVPQSTRVNLLVEFAPSVTLERTPAVVREGDTAIFRCLAEANPANLSYRWFLGGREMEGGEDGSVLVLPGLNRTSAGQIVKCQVTNIIGKSEETFSLQIYCESGPGQDTSVLHSRWSRSSEVKRFIFRWFFMASG